MYPSIATLSPSPERLALLFSPFRARSLNPDHYDQKMRFWQSVVKEFSEIEKKLCLTREGIEKQIMSQCGGRKPACLEEVLATMTRDGTLVSYDDYLSSLSLQATSSSWLAWSAQNAKRIALKFWSFNPYALMSGRKVEETTKFVCIPQIMSVIERVTSMPEINDQVKSLEELKKAIALETGLDDEDLELVIKYLKAAGRLVTDNLKDEYEVAKLIPTPNSPGITQVEKGRFDIRRTMEVLERDLNQLNEKRDKSQSLAKAALKDGKRFSAKSHLRVSHSLQKRIEKVSNVLDTLSAIEIQIDAAESDAKVLNAYEVGKRTMNQLLKDNNLTTDRVTEVMLDVQELLDEGADISAAISQPIDNEDMSLLEEELDALMREPELPTSSKDDDETLKMLDGLKLTDESLPNAEKTAATERKRKAEEAAL